MLTYVDAIKRTDTITIDGYTSNKTEKGIIKDVARAVEKYDKAEADLLRSFLKDKITECNTPFVKPKNSDGGYFLNMKKYIAQAVGMTKWKKWNIKMDTIIIFAFAL